MVRRVCTQAWGASCDSWGNRDFEAGGYAENNEAYHFLKWWIQVQLVRLLYEVLSTGDTWSTSGRRAS